MSYQETIKVLESFQKFGIKLGLHRIQTLSGILNNPQNKFPAIIVAGTNGKGSVCAMLSSILTEAGYKVGLYTSPHLVSYTERYKINNKDISTRDFVRGLKRILKIAKKQKEKPTVFEILTALAFQYFADNNVDLAILEVGLGGRLDATNIANPILSVITNIDLEHTEYLGNTLAAIAREKSGIIKNRVSVVTAEKKNEALKIIRQIALSRQAPFIQVINRNLKFKTNLRADYQKINIQTALQAIDSLISLGWEISREQVVEGFKKVVWPGRFQIIKNNPLLIIDGAHNPAGINVFIESYKKLKISTKPIVIFGCQKNKDFIQMLKKLKPMAEQVWLVKSTNSQAADIKVLDQLAQKEKMKHMSFGNIKQALQYYEKKYSKHNLAIVGSLFLIGDTLKIVG